MHEAVKSTKDIIGVALPIVINDVATRTHLKAHLMYLEANKAQSMVAPMIPSVAALVTFLDSKVPDASVGASASGAPAAAVAGALAAPVDEAEAEIVVADAGKVEASADEPRDEPLEQS